MSSVPPRLALFERLVEASGLSGVFAEATLRQACERVGVVPERMVRSDLRKLRAELQRLLDLYLPHEAEERLRAIAALARAPSSID